MAAHEEEVDAENGEDFGLEEDESFDQAEHDAKVARGAVSSDLDHGEGEEEAGAAGLSGEELAPEEVAELEALRNQISSLKARVEDAKVSPDYLELSPAKQVPARLPLVFSCSHCQFVGIVTGVMLHVSCTHACVERLDAADRSALRP